MASEFRLPELGENIESIQVVQVMVAEGGTVEVDQPVVELETDKATIEVPSTVAGTVAAVHVQPGDDISRGQLLFSLAESRDAESAEAKGDDTSDDEDNTVASQEPEPVAAPSTSVEMEPTPPEPQTDDTPESTLETTGRKVPAAPSVRRFAREIGIDLSQVKGEGPHGRVTREDVKRHARQLNLARPVSGAAAVGAPLPALPDFSKWGQIERRKMSVIRAKTAEHMTLSWSQVPHVTIYDKVDITELEALRKQYAKLAEKEGGKLTMAVMVSKIAAQALRKFPVFNASADIATREIIFKDYVHLGVAVNTDRGLMVPVVRDADTKNMIRMSVEIQELAAKCRDGKITLDEIEGSTFTVTNLGRVCGLYFTPIVNYPEVAILGMGRAQEEPAIVQGNVVPRIMLPLSLSFDHRVIDGADGAAFLGWIKEAIEQPLMLALDG